MAGFMPPIPFCCCGGMLSVGGGTEPRPPDIGDVPPLFCNIASIFMISKPVGWCIPPPMVGGIIARCGCCGPCCMPPIIAPGTCAGRDCIKPGCIAPGPCGSIGGPGC